MKDKKAKKAKKSAKVREITAAIATGLATGLINARKAAEAASMPSGITLVPGKFYRSRDGEVWCCFKVDKSKPEHARADCVQVDGHRIEYFFLDGRYDKEGEREHTLIEVVGEQFECSTCHRPWNHRDSRFK